MSQEFLRTERPRTKLHTKKARRPTRAQIFPRCGLMIPQPVRELMPVRLKDPTMLHRFLRTDFLQRFDREKIFRNDNPSTPGELGRFG